MTTAAPAVAAAHEPEAVAKRERLAAVQRALNGLITETNPTSYQPATSHSHSHHPPATRTYCSLLATLGW